MKKPFKSFFTVLLILIVTLSAQAISYSSLSELDHPIDSEFLKRIDIVGPSGFASDGLLACGDLNNDGFDDFMIYKANFSGGNDRVQIYYGNTIIDPIADLTINLQQSGLSASMAKAGDVNGDGFSDIVIGSPQFISDSISSHGRALVYYGGNPMNNNVDLIINGTTGSDLGRSLDGVGDVNGDGYDDIVISGRINGFTKLYLGGSTMDPIADLTLFTSNASVSHAGDINDDGYSDVFLGWWGGCTNCIAIAMIFLGGASMDSIPDVITQGPLGSSFGDKVNSAGDFNGDGFSDVSVSLVSFNSFRGRVYLYYGGTAMNNVADLIITGEYPDTYYGWNVCNAGDLNGDGFSDLAITGRHETFVHIHKGGVAPDTIADIVLEGTENFGWSVCGNADFNGDGNNDLITSNPYEYQPDSGKVYLYLSLRTTLILNTFQEGFYNSVTNTQISDSVDVLLRSTSSPFQLIDSEKSFLSQTGIDTVKFGNTPSGIYYIVIKHRNSIETWSKSGGQFLRPDSTFTYDFTSASNQAYGDNLKQVDTSPLRFAIYSGDINQDGLVDVTDIIRVFNDTRNFVSGYVSTDVNGDEIVDASDLTIVYNNSLYVVSISRP